MTLKLIYEDVFLIAYLERAACQSVSTGLCKQGGGDGVKDLCHKVAAAAQNNFCLF